MDPNSAVMAVIDRYRCAGVTAATDQPLATPSATVTAATDRARCAGAKLGSRPGKKPERCPVLSTSVWPLVAPPCFFIFFA